MSILHLRSTSDPWEVGSQGSSYSVGSNKNQTGSKGKSSGNARGSYTRGTSIPSLKRHDTTASASSTSSLKQHRQDSHGQASRTKRLKNKNHFIVPYFFRNIAQFVTRYSIANYRSPNRKILCSKLLQSFSFLLFKFQNIVVFAVRARFLTIENFDHNNCYNPLKDRL